MSLPSYSSSWTKFTRRIYINTSIEMAYQSWAMQGELEKWFLKKSQFVSSEGVLRSIGDLVKTGDTFDWEWHKWPNINSNNQILLATENKEICFDLGDVGKTMVRFEKEGEFRTQIILTQYDIKEGEFEKMNFFHGFALRWSFWLVNLKAFLEYGVLLNETDSPEENDERIEIVNH